MISAALNTRLHDSLTQTDYWTYLEQKFHWTPTTRKLIAWDVYHRLLNSQPHKQHQQLLKYVIDWLPTGHEVHRHDSLEDHRCPHCLTVQEKNAHLLRCPHPSRLEKRLYFLRVTLNNYYHHSNTAQPIRELISQSIIQWFHNPSIPQRFNRHHPLYRASIHQQAIGWQNFLKGHIAISIIEYQEQYYRARERPEKDTGTTWAKKLIQKLWGHFHDIWKLRCDERHKLDTDRISQQHTHRVVGRARACYQTLPDLPATIRSHHYFRKSLEDQLNTSTRRIEEWLVHAELLIQHGHAAMAHLTASTHDIRTFFLPLEPD
jgi:hypothetical protein